MQSYSDINVTRYDKCMISAFLVIVTMLLQVGDINKNLLKIYGCGKNNVSNSSKNV